MLDASANFGSGAPLFGNADRESKESVGSIKKVDSKPQFTIKNKIDTSQERKESLVKPPSTKPMIGGKKEPYKASLTSKPPPPIKMDSYNQSAPSIVYNPPAIKSLKTIPHDESRNITEEELEDENSVKDGSYMDNSRNMNSMKPSSNNETIT